MFPSTNWTISLPRSFRQGETSFVEGKSPPPSFYKTPPLFLYKMSKRENTLFFSMNQRSLPLSPPPFRLFLFFCFFFSFFSSLFSFPSKGCDSFFFFSLDIVLGRSASSFFFALVHSRRCVRPFKQPHLFCLPIGKDFSRHLSPLSFFSLVCHSRFHGPFFFPWPIQLTSFAKFVVSRARSCFYGGSYS